MSMCGHAFRSALLHLVSPIILISFLLGCAAPQTRPIFSNDYRNSQLALSQLAKANLQIDEKAANEYLDYLGAKISSGLQSNYRLVLFKSRLPFAYSIGDNAIALSSALIEACQTESELVFVLAHEIGHYQLEHQARLQPDYNLVQEIAADDFALKLTILQGYNGCLAPSILRRISLSSQEQRHIYEKRIDSLAQLPVDCAQTLAINTTRQFIKFKDSLSSY